MDSTKIIAWWGAILSTVGIGVSILNYRSQKETQEENTAERILVRLDALVLSPESTTESAKGSHEWEMVMEVVNTGLRPLFIKGADMRIRGLFINGADIRIGGGSTLTFYAYDPTKVNEPMKSLEPSEAIRYRRSFNFLLFTGRLKDVEVQVQTTKKTFSFQHQVANIVFVPFFPDAPQNRKSTSEQTSPDH